MATPVSLQESVTRISAWLGGSGESARLVEINKGKLRQTLASIVETIEAMEVTMQSITRAIGAVTGGGAGVSKLAIHTNELLGFTDLYLRRVNVGGQASAIPSGSPQVKVYTGNASGVATLAATVDLLSEGGVLDLSSAEVELNPVKATLTTALAGADNDLVFTAVDAGDDGNDITVTYTDPSGNSQPLVVSVSGSDIDVSVETDGGGALISTAAEVQAAIEAKAEAAALVTVANSGSDDGSGAVIAMATANLSGGGLAYIDVTADSAANYAMMEVELIVRGEV